MDLRIESMITTCDNLYSYAKKSQVIAFGELYIQLLFIPAYSNIFCSDPEHTENYTQDFEE